MGKRSYFVWKLTYIALCRFSRFWLRSSLFWGNFFKDLLIWLIIVWQVCILGGWISEKYSYLLKPCCYIFQVPIIFGHFLKVITFALETSGKIQFWFIQERWIYFLVKNRNSEIFFSPNIMAFDKFAQKIYFYLLVASLYLIRNKSKIFIYSFISCWLPCPHEWFQVFALMNDFLNDLHFRI